MKSLHSPLLLSPLALGILFGCGGSTTTVAPPPASVSDSGSLEVPAAGLRVVSLQTDKQHYDEGEAITVTAVLADDKSETFSQVTVAVRDPAGNNLDFPGVSNLTVSSATTTYSQSKVLPAGTYTYWVAVQDGSQWRDLPPEKTLTVAVASAGTDAGTPPVDAGTSSGAPTPPALPGTWTLAFNDEFDGTAVNTSKWADHSPAEADNGHGNLGNKQLEWNQLANCTVANGELTMTAKREPFTSPRGNQYGWTSCLLTTTPSYAFQYAYIEERAILPAPRGFWPAFWTWDVNGGGAQETDVYEFYSDNHTALYLTPHTAGGRGGCIIRPDFDPTAGYHVYAADIQATGTTWYIDGKKVCSATNRPTAQANIITNLAVFKDQLALPSTMSATKKIDYIRAWKNN